MPATSYDLSTSSNSDKLSAAVASGTGDASNLICRSDHHGAAAVLGYTSSSGYCAVAFLGRVHRKRKFEVLINGAGAARLEWRQYSKFGQVPEGAVAVGDDAFIGRRPKGGDDDGYFAG